MIEISSADYRELQTQQWRAIRGSALLTVPIAAGILVLEYRLVLLALIALVPLLIALAGLMGAAATAKRFLPASLEWDDEGLTLRGCRETVRLAYGSVVPRLFSARASRHSLSLVQQLSENRVRRFFLPINHQRSVRLVQELRMRGVHVRADDRRALATIGVGIAAVVNALAGKAAAVLVLAGLANLVMCFADRSGSAWVGAFLLVGAFALMFIKQLLRAVVLEPLRRDP